MKVRDLWLVVFHADGRTYLVDWCSELQTEVDEIGDGRGFDDLGIPPPDRYGAWMWHGEAYVDDDTVAYRGMWRAIWRADQ